MLFEKLISPTFSGFATFSAASVSGSLHYPRRGNQGRCRPEKMILLDEYVLLISIPCLDELMLLNNSLQGVESI